VRGGKKRYNRVTKEVDRTLRGKQGLVIQLAEIKTCGEKTFKEGNCSEHSVSRNTLGKKNGTTHTVTVEGTTYILSGILNMRDPSWEGLKRGCGGAASLLG